MYLEGNYYDYDNSMKSYRVFDFELEEGGNKQVGNDF
jgi:hypothetical protein